MPKARKTQEELEKEAAEQKRLALCLVAQKLDEDFDRETREFTELQQQRDRINHFWIFSKKELDDLKTNHKNKERELQDLKEKYDIEIKTYKQKVKHLLHEHQSQITSLYIDTELTKKHLEDDHTSEEELLKYDIHTLRSQLKDMEYQHENYIKTLKMELDRMIANKRAEIEKNSEDYIGRYNDIMRNLIEDMENRRKDELEFIDRQKKIHIDNLRLSHEKAFNDIKNYYNDITHNNLDLIKSLKEEVATLKKKETQDEKMMFDLAQENKNMAEPLNQALEEVKLLRIKLTKFENDKIRLNEIEKTLIEKENELNILEWEHEVLKQRFTGLSFEYDRMFDTFQDAAYDAKQKTGFQNLLLEKRLIILKENIIIKDAQLNELLSKINVDNIDNAHGNNTNTLNPTLANHSNSNINSVHKSIDDLVEIKNNKIRELQSELDKIIRIHNVTIELFENRLNEYCIPVEELGFKPKYAKMPNIDIRL